MIKKVVTTFIMTLILGAAAPSVLAGPANDFLGKWKFSVPDAPYGYNNGVIEIKKDGDEFTGTMKFQDYEYLFPCEGLKIEDEKLSFGLYVDGTDVFIVLSFSEEDKISGRAVTPDGEVTITATREKE